MNLVTGYRGYAHVTSNDEAALIKAVFGSGHCVINTGSVFAATMVDAGTMRIADGEAIIQGHHARIEPGEHEDVELIPGASGTNRIDYIAIRYMKNSSGVESAEIVQICGVATLGTPSPPALTQNDTNEYGAVYEMALYSVTFSGVSIGAPAKVITPVNPVVTQIDDMAKTLQGELSKKQNTITGAATTIIGNNLTANRALVSDKSGKVGVSAATATELSYIAGLTSKAQAQFDKITSLLNNIGRYYAVGSESNLASDWTWKKKNLNANLTATAVDSAATLSGGDLKLPMSSFAVISVRAVFASNSSGQRGVRICRVNADGSENTITGTTGKAIGHGHWLAVTGCFYMPADTKIRIYVMQDSGKTLSCTTYCNVIAIPNF